MIYDIMENAPLYRGISPALDAALELISTTDMSQWPNGRRDFDLGVYTNVMDCALKPADDTKWERHRRYLDIQIGFGPSEDVGVLPDRDVSGWGAHDEEKDICFADGAEAGVRVPLTPGAFLVLFPTDAHRPCIAAGAQSATHKVVVKVPV